MANKSGDLYANVGTCSTSHEEITLCYNTFGDSKDPCVLLIMGLNCPGPYWEDDFCGIISARGYFVVRFDNRDCGLSTILRNRPSPSVFRALLPSFLSYNEPVPYTLEDMAVDALNLLSSLSVKEAHIVGCSMGGMIAQVMALKKPEVVKSLSLVSTHSGTEEFVMPGWRTIRIFLKSPKSKAVDDVVDFKASFFSAVSGDYQVDEEHLRAHLYRMHERSPVNSGFSRQLAALYRAPSRGKHLKTLQSSTLIIHGGMDVLVPVANAMYMGSCIPNSKVVVFPKMGHYFLTPLHDSIARQMLLHFEENSSSITV